MSEPQSRRGRILKNLKRQLETITVANGYIRDIASVSYEVKNFHELPKAETPVLFIVDETTALQYHAGKTVEHTWTLGIFGVLKDSSQYEMEETISDIQTCLFKNVTLSFDGLPGPVSHVRIRNIITDRQLFAAIENTELFKIVVDIKYTACVDDYR